jgi:hypothetical protein
MNQIKIALVLIVAMFVLLVVGGVTPTLAGSPNTAPPTVVLPTPAATQPKPVATTASAGKAPTRAAPVTAPTRVAPAAVKAPKGPAGSWGTDFTLFNLSSSVAATGVTLTRYCSFSDAACAVGGNPFAVPGPTGGQIAANGSYYYNPANDSSFPSFSGSIVVSAGSALAGTVTLANNLTGVNYASDAYSAVTDPNSTVYVPIAMSGFGPWNTRITVQNAGTTTTNVTIHYGGASAPGDSTINNLPANQMAMVDQLGLITNFNGSAVVTSSNGQNLAVVVEEYKTTGGTLMTYNGIPLTNAAQTIYMPGYLDRGVWLTDFTIVNTTGTAISNANVTFAGSTATLSGPIGANGSVYLNRTGTLPTNWTGSFPTNYYGAATVTAGQNIVTAYNIGDAGLGNHRTMAYVGFAASAASTTVVVPLIENMAGSGWNTTFSVQSIDGNPANLSLTYSGNLAPVCNPCTFNMTGASTTFTQTSDGHVPSGFIGGVRVTSTNGKQLVVIADQDNRTAANYQGGDTAAGFVGFAAQ